MANGTLSFLSGAEFDESAWCEAPAPRKSSVQRVLDYAASARSPQLTQTGRFTQVLN